MYLVDFSFNSVLFICNFLISFLDIVVLYLQASEDAKKLVNQEKSFACAEIESARAVVQRFGELFEEEEKCSPKSKMQVGISSDPTSLCNISS